MPFLRFGRDKRGYETTALVYAGRRQSRSRPRILYWFRTPPGIKVGRAALDEHAIRWIEEQNPDIHFDWQKILDAKPPSAPPPDDARYRRGRRPAPDRRSASRPQPDVEPEAPDAAPIDVPDLPQAAPEPDAITDAVTELDVDSGTSEDDAALSAPGAPVSGAGEQMVRLHARYAEILARIAERGGDAERIAALRIQAEALNPAAWVTPDETKAGVEQFERRLQDLRAALGLHRRRRSRRGGRRRRGGGGNSPAGSPPETSNQNQD